MRSVTPDRMVTGLPGTTPGQSEDSFDNFNLDP